MVVGPAAVDTRHLGEAAEEDAERRYRPYYVNSWAAVIGINSYEHAKPLNYAVADAEGIATLLIARLGFPRENVFVVLDSPPAQTSTPYQLYSDDAAKATIERLLLTDLPSKALDDDRVLIFFAGHGQRRPLADGATKGYLMPADARPGQWHEWIDIDSILDSNLYEAKHVFYLLDACYSGLAQTRAPKGTSRYEQDLLTRRARQVLTAGKDDQVVDDAGGEGHSIFTNCVLEGLGDSLAAPEGSEMVTGFDLMRYVTRRVALDTNSLQTPDEGTRLGHRGGDFVFRLPQTFGAFNRLIQEGLRAMLRHDVPRLDELVTQLKAENPDYPTTLYLQSRLKFMQGDIRAAAQIVSRLRDQDLPPGTLSPSHQELAALSVQLSIWEQVLAIPATSPPIKVTMLTGKDHTSLNEAPLGSSRAGEAYQIESGSLAQFQVTNLSAAPVYLYFIAVVPNGRLVMGPLLNLRHWDESRLEAHETGIGRPINIKGLPGSVTETRVFCSLKKVPELMSPPSTASHVAFGEESLAEMQMSIVLYQLPCEDDDVGPPTPVDVHAWEAAFDL